MQNLKATQQQLDNRDAYIKKIQSEDKRMASIFKAILEAQHTRKEQKTSQSFGETEKIKCATNYLIDKASLWWYVVLQSTTRPTTWASFQEVFKKAFLPPQFHLDARRSWSRLMWQEGDDVYKYTEQFLTNFT